MRMTSENHYVTQTNIIKCQLRGIFQPQLRNLKLKQQRRKVKNERR
jgi:hypothetical protein